jgi:hypothetical protein
MKKNFVVGLLLTIFIISPFSMVNAQVASSEQTYTLSPADQLDALSAALISIGSAIASSPALSDTDRLTLMRQLVAISSQIVTLRTIPFSLPSSQLTQVTIDPDEERRKDTARQAGLENVKVSYDMATNQVVFVNTYSNSSRNSTTTQSFPELNTVAGFTRKVELLRELATSRVSNQENVRFADVEKILFVSSKDPIRDMPVAPNSATAQYLTDNFAQNSIVNRVEVYPGVHLGIIRLLTDQDEYLDLVIRRELDDSEFGSGRPLNTFSYSTNFYLPSRFDTLSDWEGNPIPPVPKISLTTTGVPEAEIRRYILNLFNDIPFTSQVSNFSPKFLNFLTANPARYVSSNNGVQPSVRDCYVGSDKVVVTEFIKYLVDGLDAQYEDVDDIIAFLAPVVQPEEFDFGSSCRSSNTRFF